MGFHQWVEVGMLAVMIAELGLIIWLLDRKRTDRDWRHDQPLMKGMGAKPQGRPPLDGRVRERQS